MYSASRLLLLSILAVAACGGHGGGPAQDGPDARGAADAAPGRACDVLAQSGCNAGEKCAWVRTAASATSAKGEAVCVPDGDRSNGQVCHFGATGIATGFDDCEKGLTCEADIGVDKATGVCTKTCDIDAKVDACGPKAACTAHTGYFFDLTNVEHRRGLCAPTCDPVSNTRYDGAASCGGTLDAQGVATRSCVVQQGELDRLDTFTCNATRQPGKGSDALAYEASFDDVFNDSCAPGFTPLLYQDTKAALDFDVSKIICVAWCEPGPTSKEDPADLAGKVGSAYTCPKRGASAAHECKYYQWIGAVKGTQANTLGYCEDPSRYRYDSNKDNKLDDTDEHMPSCATLSRTGHTFDKTVTDTQFWGCEPLPANLAATPRLRPRAISRDYPAR